MAPDLPAPTIDPGYTGGIILFLRESNYLGKRLFYTIYMRLWKVS
jgi:hypothetical protein